MPERPGFQRLQYAFAAHIRDPRHAPPPAGIGERRMRVYRDLLFDNVEHVLAETLPLTRRALAADAWHALVRGFFVQHRARSPYFRDMPREFLDYLENARGLRAGDPPFLYELAHYEWVELALALHADADEPAERDGDLLDGHPLVSPLAWPLCYRHPVQRIAAHGSDGRAEPPDEPTRLLAYRDRDDDVRRIELNAVSARLFGLLSEHADDRTYTGRQALAAIAAELRHPEPAQVLAGGAALLEDWCARGILLGAARVPERGFNDAGPPCGDRGPDP